MIRPSIVARFQVPPLRLVAPRLVAAPHTLSRQIPFRRAPALSRSTVTPKESTTPPLRSRATLQQSTTTPRPEEPYSGGEYDYSVKEYGYSASEDDCSVKEYSYSGPEYAYSLTEYDYSATKFRHSLTETNSSQSSAEQPIMDILATDNPGLVSDFNGPDAFRRPQGNAPTAAKDRKEMMRAE